MSSSKTHAIWLSLLEISGPFLSINTLMRVFPNGLDKANSESRDIAELKAAYAEWQAERDNPAIHRAWVQYVLQTVLKWEEGVLAEGQAIPEAIHYNAIEHGNETIRPDYILHERQRPQDLRALVLVYPPEQALEKAVSKRAWSASPATRMLSLLHATGVRLGLVTNGEQWMLVNAPKEGLSGYVSWYAELWGEDRETYRAFVSLLDLPRFFGVADEDTLPAMLDESANDAQEVTDQLGAQVRAAVEILVRAFDKLDQGNHGQLLKGVSESKLYEASLTVMMRLVFLLSAEERGLFLLGDPLYDQNYALSTLRAQLHEAADHSGEAVLERRNDAWSRLLATFRLVYFGSAHEDLQLPAYGGSLFDPNRFPFLEGHSIGIPPEVNNRTVLHLLDALQILQLKGEARRLSFRSLDIEQIGHVYEGLLDHEARRASQVMLGLGGKFEPEIALSELEKFMLNAPSSPTLLPATGEGRKQGSKQSSPLHAEQHPSPQAKRDGEGQGGEVVKFLKDATGRGESAIKNDLRKTPDADRLRRLSMVCQNEGLFKRVQPYLNLLRDDELGYPVVILSGSVFVTAGTERRATGTHYTPKTLTEPIVQHTLEPLVYIGVAEGASRENWRLISPSELLELKVCDMAMGSGAFLVQACRYLGTRLVEAWEQVLNAPSSPTLLPATGEGSNKVSLPLHTEQLPSPQMQQEGEINPMLGNLPSPQAKRDGEGRGGEAQRLEITLALRQRMIEVARVFRKEPTESEDTLWQALRDRQLDGRKFRRQQPIGAFIVDFFCPAERLVVEVDGRIHETQKEADAQRQALIESVGYRFVRLSADLVENQLDDALYQIRGAFMRSPSSPTLLPAAGEGSNSNKVSLPLHPEQLPSPQVQQGRGLDPMLGKLPSSHTWTGTHEQDKLPSPQAKRDGEGRGGEVNSPLHITKRDGEGQGVRTIPHLTIFGHAPTGALGEILIPDDPQERLTLALRLIADRCLYGVDKNPLAVEMGKLSLWLTTLAKGRPFTFLDHALKCGDSLVGVSLKQLRYWSLESNKTPKDVSVWAVRIYKQIDEVAILRQKLESFTVMTVEDQREKQRLFAEAEARLHDLRHAANLLLASYLNDDKPAEQLAMRGSLLDVVRRGTDIPQAYYTPINAVEQLCPFHWELEFPEVFGNALNAPSSPTLLPATGEGRKQENRQSIALHAEQLPVAGEGRKQGGKQSIALRADGEGRTAEAKYTGSKQSSPSSPTLLPAAGEGRKQGNKQSGKLPSPQAKRDGEGRGGEAHHGFHAFIGNPPFIGGQKITGLMGVPYRNYLINTLANGQKGSADLCAYFFLRAYRLLRPRGAFGLIATNTISQGDTREVGLDQLVKDGATLYHAENNHAWEGAAAVVVNIVHAYKGQHNGTKTLDHARVDFISPLLDSTQTLGNPYPLHANAGKSFIGSYVLGMGFVLEPDEAHALIAKDPRNREVLFPYLNGEDLNTHPEQQPSRWVINFFDWSEERAMQYPDCYAIVRELVKPERQRLNEKGEYALRKPLPQKWWIYGEKRPALYATIAPLNRVLVAVQTSKYLSIGFQPVGMVYSHMTVVFALDQYQHFGLLNTSFHDIWVRKYASTLETRMRYIPTDCFQNFPLPSDHALASLESIGERYHETRRQIMLARQEGLTKTYNRFHNPAEKSADIHGLRELHRQLDEQVALAYGWGDLHLGHGFHETAQGVRYTLHEGARRDVLKRLLALNFDRYAQEVAGGLHTKKDQAKFYQEHPEYQRTTPANPPALLGRKQVPDFDDYTEQPSLFNDNKQDKLF